jgi:hypothetical protein
MSGTALVAALAVLLSVQNGPEEKELARFLTLAVFDGLWEDGAEADVVKDLAKDDHPVYIYKCPICMPVLHAFKMLAAAPPPPMYDGRGAGLPKEIVGALKAGDLPTRKKGFEALVKRYVERRFERLKMTDEEKTRLRALIERGRKAGMSYKSLPAGDFCPSCDGASKALK